MIQTLKSVLCNKNEKLPYTSIIETKLEETLNFCYIPKAASIVLEAKRKNEKRMCPICGKTYNVRRSHINLNQDINLCKASWNTFFSFLFSELVCERPDSIQPAFEDAQGPSVQLHVCPVWHIV